MAPSTSGHLRSDGKTWGQEESWSRALSTNGLRRNPLLVSIPLQPSRGPQPSAMPPCTALH